MTFAFPPEILTCEMHTGGEPVRIVTGGYPHIPGATILDKRRYARERLDHLRRFLMHEPRGHADMYGVIPVEPDHPDADLAVLFCHNEGYSTMCGHATIAVARWAVDEGLVAPREPRATVRIQCPCGLVTAHAQVAGGRAGTVHFESVGAFAPLLGAKLEVEGAGTVGGRRRVRRRLLRLRARLSASGWTCGPRRRARWRTRPGRSPARPRHSSSWTTPPIRTWPTCTAPS